MGLRNVPKGIPDYASMSMSLSAGHRLKASLGRRSCSTVAAKLDSILTSTIKKSPTTSRSPSVTTQRGGCFGSRGPASWVHHRHSRMTMENNTKAMTALHTVSQRCCIPRRGMECNPTQASDTQSSLTRQGGTRNSTTHNRNHCGNQCSSCRQLS